jgi:hypothetical protein
MRAPGSLPVARLVWTKCERHRGAVRSLSQCAISDRRSLVRAGCCLSSRAGCRKRRRRSPPPGEARHKSGCRRTGSRRSRAERQRRSAGTRSASVSETHSSSEGGRGRLADGLEHERGHDAEARLGRPAERPEEISAGIDDLADGEQGLGAARSEPESGPCIRPRIPSPFPGLSPPLLASGNRMQRLANAGATPGPEAAVPMQATRSAATPRRRADAGPELPVAFPTSLAAGDFDDDGRPALAVVSQGRARRRRSDGATSRRQARHSRLDVDGGRVVKGTNPGA